MDDDGWMNDVRWMMDNGPWWIDGWVDGLDDGVDDWWADGWMDEHIDRWLMMDGKFCFNPVMAGWKVKGLWRIWGTFDFFVFPTNPADWQDLHAGGTHTAGHRLCPSPSSECLFLGWDPEKRLQLEQPSPDLNVRSQWHKHADQPAALSESLREQSPWFRLLPLAVIVTISEDKDWCHQFWDSLRVYPVWRAEERHRDPPGLSVLTRL